MISRRALSVLVAAALVCPVAIAIVLAVARLLAAMQDEAGANALDRIALAVGILWAIDLVCLVLVQSINSLGNGPPDGDS